MAPVRRLKPTMPTVENATTRAVLGVLALIANVFAQVVPQSVAELALIQT